MTGLEQRAANGDDLDGIASVASFFISRVDTEVDKRLASPGPRIVTCGRTRELLGQAALANARLAYEVLRCRAVFGSMAGAGCERR